MSDTDDEFTYNEPRNEDKELLLAHGYVPGELAPEEEQELLMDLHEQTDGDEDSERLSGSVPTEEQDGTT